MLFTALKAKIGALSSHFSVFLLIMKIHEYQGKAILREYGVPVPRGVVARSPEEAEAAARELGTDIVVVKAQIHAAGAAKVAG